MQTQQEGQPGSRDDSWVARTDNHIKCIVEALLTIAETIPLQEWLIGLAVVSLIVLLVGLGPSIWFLLWCLIVISAAFAIIYTIGLLVDATKLGFTTAGGKLQVVCGLLLAMVFGSFLPSTSRDDVGQTARDHDGSPKAVTLAYWRSLGSLIEKCETAEERCKADFLENSDSTSQESPFDILRRQLVEASKEFNRLSVANVDPKAIEIGIEFDSILLESISLLDEAMGFLKRHFTITGLFQALLIGTDAEEASMNESQQRLHDRGIRWEERVTAARIELSTKYGVTFPNLVSPK